MGFLELDGVKVKDDNLFQRMFWPSDHPGEADALGKQGLWVCWIVGVLSLLTLTVGGQPVTAVLTLAFFVLGGIGVREHSQPAAVLVAGVYGLNLVASIFMGMAPGVLTIIAFGLLLANVRGTYIAAKWARLGGDEVMPQRFNETFLDKLTDQMPRTIWRGAKIPFFCVAAIYLLLTVVGTIFLAAGGARRLHAKTPAAADSETIQVTPSR